MKFDADSAISIAKLMPYILDTLPYALVSL